jgi:hypothetical protein
MSMCDGTKTSTCRGLIRETLYYNIILYWSVNNNGKIKHMHKLSHHPTHPLHLTNTNTKECFTQTEPQNGNNHWQGTQDPRRKS